MNEEVAAKIDDFFSQFPTRKYTKGQILLLNGEEAQSVYQLLKGRVKQYDVTLRGDEVILNVLHPPAFFPMSLALSGKASEHIFEAESEIEIRKAPADDTVKFVKDNPEVMFDLLSRVYRGMDGILKRMTHLMSGSAKSRLMFEMYVEAKRFGKEMANGTYLIDINEKDLGARAGLSRETVSREIHKMKEQGVIEAKPKGLLLKNMAIFENP